MAIYLDHAAATPLDKDVYKAMQPYFTEHFGNPSSLHNLGFTARDALVQARETVAKVLHCSSREIIFTSGGTESINLAIQGVALGQYHHGKKILTTKIEHPAVLATCAFLEKKGFIIDYVNVDRTGMIDMQDLQEKLTKDVILLSIAYANNEIGTIQDIQALAKLCKKHKVLLHLDACQAANYLDLDVTKLGCDLLSLNGSKLYGPKGTGVLYKKQNLKIYPLLQGGGQEHDLRSGTENLPAIVGFAKALEKVQIHKDKESKRLTSLRDAFVQDILAIEGTSLNGPLVGRLANNVNISFKGLDAKAMLIALNDEGIYTSTGSACSEQKAAPSHVLQAIGVPKALASASIRFSLGQETTEKELNTVIQKLKEIVQELRK